MCDLKSERVKALPCVSPQGLRLPCRSREDPAQGDIQSRIFKIEEVVTDVWNREDDPIDAPALSKSGTIIAYQQIVDQTAAAPGTPNIIRGASDRHKSCEDVHTLRPLPAINKALLSMWSYFKFPRI